MAGKLWKEAHEQAEPPSEIPITEPMLVPVLTCDYVRIQRAGDGVAFVAFVTLMDHGEGQERRIIARLALTLGAAEQAHSMFNKIWPKDRDH